eukprot:680615-Alexandrium_andersonii.AAC.1
MCGCDSRRHSQLGRCFSRGARGTKPAPEGAGAGYWGPSQRPAASSAMAGRATAASRTPPGPRSSPKVG